MLIKLFKYSAAILVLLTVAAATLYAFGARVVLDGGGSPYIAFLGSAGARAEAVARHRSETRGEREASIHSEPDEQRQPNEPIRALDPAGAPVTSPDAPPSHRALTALPWPEFRGPRRDGHARGVEIRTDWPAQGLVPMWKQPVGEGYASFVVAGGSAPRAFTIEQRAAEEVVAAYDIATGREQWTHRWKARFSEMMGGDGPRATPTWHNGRVYALGAGGELRVLNAVDGALVWRTNILEDARVDNKQWGMAGAPLVVDGTVVVTPGGPNGRSIVAYDAVTGRTAWSALDDPASYSSPMLVTIGGVRQILVFTSHRLAGLTTDGRRVLWEYPWRTSPDVNASQPLLVGDNRVFVSTGYGKGAALIELTRTGDEFAVREVWRNIRMKNQFTSSVLRDGYIYGLDGAILACIEAATGDLMWKGGRYGYGQVMLVDGHLIVLTEGGDLALVRATPERHAELSRFSVFNARTWNHPAMAGPILLVRNLAEMAAFDLRR